MSSIPLLAKHFFLLSWIAFGGASATVPEMHRVLVDSLHWMDDGQFRALFAISQAAPGPNVLFVALFGWQVAGFAGAFVSLFSMCGPVSLLALSVEHFGGRYQNSAWYSSVRRGLAPITIGLLLSTGYVLERGIAKPASVALSAATVTLALSARFNPIWLIAAGAVLGATGWI